MGSKKKLLFVTDVFPFPLDRGQRVRVQNLLAACSRAFETTFIGPPPERDADRHELEKICSHVAFEGPLPTSRFDRLSLAARTVRSAPGVPRPATLRKYEPLVAALDRVRPDSFDLVWAERPHIARVCAKYRAKTILDLDDIEHLKIARRLKVKQGAKQRANDAYSYLLYRHLELSWSRRFLAAVVCSDEDRKYLEGRGCANAVVVPNGPNIARPWATLAPPRARAQTAPGEPLRVAFLGNVDSRPNADAIAFFANDVLPLLRAQAPDVKLEVIGQGASPELAAEYASRVIFRGFVDDLGAALAEYDVLVAPLRFGGGTKLKVLDAMAYCVPVVTTAVGAEGLFLEHGEHVWLAETAQAIADGIMRVKRDAALADRLVKNAYALVRDRFSWTAIQERLSGWLETLRPSR